MRDLDEGKESKDNPDTFKPPFAPYQKEFVDENGIITIVFYD